MNGRFWRSLHQTTQTGAGHSMAERVENSLRHADPAKSDEEELLRKEPSSPARATAARRAAIDQPRSILRLA
jgi:hypothetical protein